MLMLFEPSETHVGPDEVVAGIVAGDRAWSTPAELAELLGAPLLAVEAALVELYAAGRVEVWPWGGMAFTLSALEAEARGVEVREPAGDGVPRWCYVGATDDRAPVERKVFRSTDPRWLRDLIAPAPPNRKEKKPAVKKSDGEAAEEARARALRKARRRARLAG